MRRGGRFRAPSNAILRQSACHRRRHQTLHLGRRRSR